ncbi:MAG: trypsin-like peptidase domain-containing protein [Limisphaerales bacterium]
MHTLRRTLITGLLAAGLQLGGQLRAAGESPSAMDMARQLNEAFIAVADRVSASVVVIEVTQGIVMGEAIPEEQGLWEFLPREFRRDLEERFRRDEGGPPRSHPPVRGQGSGFVIRDDGFILTNWHVVEKADKIKVRFKDGKEHEAAVRGSDAQSDLAVLKVEATGLKALALADSGKVRVGEFAIAVGAPFDLDYTVTVGHVSAKGRGNIIPGSMGASMDQDFIQTDASINPGNSGGPLVNLDGQVIGVNTMIRGMNTGIGFAFPSSLARVVADRLIADGKYTRAWLGLEIRALRDDEDYRGLVKAVEEGVVVRGIRRDGPAALSDLKPGDVVIAVEGMPVANAQQFREAVRAKDIGSTVNLDVIRNNKPLKIKVKTAAWPEEVLQATARPRANPQSVESEDLGLTVKPLNSELAKEFGLEVTEGVVVTGVVEAGLAARKGVQPGDVITEIGDTPIETLKSYRDAIQGVDLQRGVLVQLVRDGVSRLVVLKEAGE